MGDKTEDKTSKRRTIQHRHKCGQTMGDNGLNGREGETRRREGGHTIQQRETRREMGEKGKQDLGKADTPSNTGRQEETRPREGGHAKAEAPSKTGTHVRRQWETKREDKTSKRRTIQHRHKCGQTMGDNGLNGREGETRPPQAHMWGDNGREWGTMGDTWRPGRQDLEKAGTHIYKKGKQEGRWRQWKTTRRDKTLGRRTRHPTQTYIVGRQWRQGETRRDKGRQDLEKAETPSGRQTITGTHVGSDNGRQKGETRRREGGRTSKHRHTCAETMGDNGRQLVQWETRVDKTSGRQTTRGDKTAGRGTHHPKHAGTHVRRQWETRVDG